MTGYVGPETMFMLSLKPEQREFLTDAVEEALKLRSEGLNNEDISYRLAHAILTIEKWTSTPRIVRRLILGTYETPSAA
jgi:hypothetical protein